MTEHSWNIPQELLDQAQTLFPPEVVKDAQKVFRSSEISISFVKEAPQKYYIISGIIRGHRSYQSKLVFRTRLQKENPLSSNCDCYQWHKDRPCPHVACLFLHYHLNKMQRRSTDILSSSLTSLGVSVPEYGTIITAPHSFEGAFKNSTYSSLQYCLDDKRVINFPTPQNFQGKLLIDIESSGHSLFFKYCNKNGEEFYQISLFQNIYLFNWKTGEVFYLPSKLKDFVQKIQIQGHRLGIDDLIRFSTRPELEEFCETRIEKVPLKDAPRLLPKIRLTLSKNKRKQLIRTELTFHDDQNRVLLPPTLLTHFNFKEGLLSSFKKKNDAYEFIIALSQSIEKVNESYKKDLILSSEKNRLNDLIEHLLKDDNTLIYDPYAQSSLSIPKRSH